MTQKLIRTGRSASVRPPLQGNDPTPKGYETGYPARCRFTLTAGVESSGYPLKSADLRFAFRTVLTA